MRGQREAKDKRKVLTQRNRLQYYQHYEHSKKTNQMNTYIVTEIYWDTDGNIVDLPSEVTFSLVSYFSPELDHEEAIHDYLSSEYGWDADAFKYELK